MPPPRGKMGWPGRKSIIPSPWMARTRCSAPGVSCGSTGRKRATWRERSPTSLAAEHSGYSRLGILHRRKLIQIDPAHWQVKDDLLPTGSGQAAHTFILHWLLPDWPWELKGTTLSLQAPVGKITLAVALSEDAAQVRAGGVQLIRGGEVLSGAPTGCPPVLGWYSPTYGIKLPALSLRYFYEGQAPLSLTSDWTLSPGHSIRKFEFSDR